MGSASNCEWCGKFISIMDSFAKKYCNVNLPNIVDQGLIYDDLYEVVRYGITFSNNGNNYNFISETIYFDPNSSDEAAIETVENCISNDPEVIEFFKKEFTNIDE